MVAEFNEVYNNSVDEELMQFIQQQKARIKVVGTGGGGNNTISRISEIGVVGAETIAINTDAQDLLYTKADKKILIGKGLTKGLGAGADPRVGEEAAKESIQDIRKALENSDMVFITCGLGGGTGTGSAPVIADISKKIGALTVAIVTLPFMMEGRTRTENAIQGLMKLNQVVDTLIVIPNDKLLDLVPNLPIHTAFKVADEILTNAVKGTAEMVTKAGLVNLDFADIKSIMSSGGVAMIGLGESDSENRSVEAVEKAIENPLLDVDISGAKGALINITGGDSLTLDESKKIVEAVTSRLSDDANVIWGAQLSKDMGNVIRVMIIVTGVKSRQIFGKDVKYHDIDEDELGIDFID